MEKQMEEKIKVMTTDDAVLALSAGVYYFIGSIEAAIVQYVLATTKEKDLLDVDVVSTALLGVASGINTYQALTIGDIQDTIRESKSEIEVVHVSVTEDWLGQTIGGAFASLLEFPNRITEIYEFLIKHDVIPLQQLEESEGGLSTESIRDPECGKCSVHRKVWEDVGNVSKLRHLISVFGVACAYMGMPPWAKEHKETQGIRSGYEQFMSWVQGNEG